MIVLYSSFCHCAITDQTYFTKQTYHTFDRAPYLGEIESVFMMQYNVTVCVSIDVVNAGT
ncbi:hypothetical protein EYS14_11660 [Alteromonadaceae bacterium M269]|nr:hypothetical protein EYS14_11660 [Alteromonadaceae bacterium M269]